jgi:hypothetical protein
MGERFGKRWLEEYGPEPTRAWRDTLDRYTPTVIADALGALKDRPERVRAHPPTLDEFAAILVSCDRKATPAAVDYSRGYWRSIVVRNLERDLCYERKLVKVEDLEAYIARREKPFGSLRQLLDELCDMERKNSGQRTLGMYQLAGERCRSTVLVAIETNAGESHAHA